MSEWQENALERRDFRATKNGPEVAPHRSKKDTRRWCRGKVGREHVWETRHDHSMWLAFCIDRCAVCGKEVWQPCP